MNSHLDLPKLRSNRVTRVGFDLSTFSLSYHMTVARYATPITKADVLNSWQKVQLELPTSSGSGGRGYPDDDIIPWCERLNAIPGVCTLQSCAGHAIADGGVSEPAHLWLWLDRETSAAFDSAVFTLATKTAFIERIGKFYMPWMQEVVTITFAGNERGLLHHSMCAILAFFESLRPSDR